MIIIVGAVALAATVYNSYTSGRKSWAVFIISLYLIGQAFYQGTGNRIALYQVGPDGSPDSTQSVNSSPDIGIYAIGVGGLLGLLGGYVMRVSSPTRVSAPSAAAAPPPEPTKRCPECAETVLAAARVCKHCGYRFPTDTEAGASGSGLAVVADEPRAVTQPTVAAAEQPPEALTFDVREAQPATPTDQIEPEARKPAEDATPGEPALPAQPDVGRRRGRRKLAIAIVIATVAIGAGVVVTLVVTSGGGGTTPSSSPDQMSASVTNELISQQRAITSASSSDPNQATQGTVSKIISTIMGAHASKSMKLAPVSGQGNPPRLDTFLNGVAGQLAARGATAQSTRLEQFYDQLPS